VVNNEWCKTCEKKFADLEGFYSQKLFKIEKIVIARYEAIPNLQRGYVSPPCKVEDCFVPRNDVERYTILLNA
jgi:predicted methyltransferase